MKVIQDLFNPWTLVGLHIPLFVFALIGSWVATMGIRRPAEFSRTLARGIAGGAVGGFLNPMLIIMCLNGLIAGSKESRGEALIAMPFLLVEGAVLSLPLAMLMAVLKEREPPIELEPPT